MKFCRFDAGGGPRLGAVDAGRIVDLHAAARSRMIGGVSGADAAFDLWYGQTMHGFITGGPAAMHNARELVTKTLDKPGPEVHEVSAVRLLAPDPKPSKIICVGQNYMDHIREQQAEIPTTPILFSKAPSSIIGPGDSIRWPAGLTEQADPEVELGVIIGKTMKGVSADRALEHVFGYTVLNDVSARDVQFGDKQWVRGKSFDSFCPMGPVIVTRDEITNVQNLKLTCTVSGRVWQKSNTKEMIFPVADLLAFICRGITLLPGDVIATGTPHGVGAFQTPPCYLKAGDTLRLEVQDVGVLENPVQGPE